MTRPFRIMKSKYGGRCFCSQYCGQRFAVNDIIAWQGGEQMSSGQFDAGKTWILEHVPVAILLENLSTVLSSPLITQEMLKRFREMGLAIPEERLPEPLVRNILTEQVGRVLDLDI